MWPELAHAQVQAQAGDGGSCPGQQGNAMKKECCEGEAVKTEERRDVCIVEKGRTEDAKTGRCDRGLSGTCHCPEGLAARRATDWSLCSCKLSPQNTLPALEIALALGAMTEA